MLSVSESYKQAINADTRNMPYRVKLAGAIMMEQKQIPKMSLTESVSDSSGISIGTSNSATLTLALREAETIDYTNVLVEPEVGLTLPNGTIEWLPLGKFWVTSFSTNNDYKTVNLNCSDGMYLLSGGYVSTLTYPTTIEAVVTEITSKAGIVFVAPEQWPNVEVRKKPEGLTYREAIGYAAGCMGCNARFNRNGALEFVWYTDTGITIARKTQYLNGMTKLNDKPLYVKFDVNGQQETYEITAISDGNGGITATPGSRVVEGETVVVSVNPFSGYELATITAVAENGNEITLYMSSEGGRTFVQPDSNVTITASFRKIAVNTFDLITRAYDNGSIRASGLTFSKGASVTVYVKTNSGYELDKFVTTPANLGLTKSGTNSIGETLYKFTMPESDVTINAYFKAEATYYDINPSIEGNGAMLILDPATGEYLSEATEGTTVSVNVSPSGGYVFDKFDSDVVLTQVDTNKYKFVMPARGVSISAHFKMSEDESKAGLYSWLHMPQSAPTAKPYWAVFYKESDELPTCQKYHLVWFDSWKATGYDLTNDRREYSIEFKGYYYCGSKNNGHGKHEWDTSSWSGNGASGSTLEWDAYIGAAYTDWDVSYGPSTQYSLLASNVHLFYNSSLIFEKCENAIQAAQTDYLQDGMDVREKGSLTDWQCPDTFSTPMPAPNWMILKPADGFYMTVNKDGEYVPEMYFPNSVIVLFYDNIRIQNLGAIFSEALVGPSDEEVYLATPTNGRWAYIRENGSSWDTLYELSEGAVFGLRNPLITTQPSDAYIGGNGYNFAGILATNQTLYDTSGNVFMYKNSCRICDCSSEKVAVRMFAAPKSRSISDSVVIEAEDISVSTSDDTIYITSDLINVETSGSSLNLTIGEIVVPTDVAEVTISYTNPLIYEKMVPAISSLVGDITYTPAKVKHRGNPAFQAGDIVTVPDGKGVSHTILIMQQTMNFGGGMNSEITCPGKTQNASSFSANGPITTQIKREVQQSCMDLERRISANNSLVYASIYKTISSTESKISGVVEWQTEANATLAEIEQTADANSAKISLVVGQNGIVNENGAVQGSIVIEAINGESSAKIAADRLDIEGKTLNIKVAATNITGILSADQIDANTLKGKTITGGTISGGTISGTTITGSSFSIMNSSGTAATTISSNGVLSCVGANISGHIVASSGEFTGDIWAANGYFGGEIASVTGNIGNIGVDSGGIRKGRKYFGANVGTEKNGFYISSDGVCGPNFGGASLATYGGISLGSYSWSSFSEQYIYEGRHVIIGTGGYGFGKLVLKYDGISFGYSDTEPNFHESSTTHDSDTQVAAINIARTGATLNGTWFDSSGTGVSSDENAKNAISVIDEKYDLFFDNLSAVTYKYNDGTSDRLHTGFIAQSVKSALDTANLSTQEFAGLIIAPQSDDTEKWYLRYNEFVALNTWQIQKLKARIEELEKKLGGQTNE